MSRKILMSSAWKSFETREMSRHESSLESFVLSFNSIKTFYDKTAAAMAGSNYHKNLNFYNRVVLQRLNLRFSEFEHSLT